MRDLDKLRLQTTPYRQKIKTPGFGRMAGSLGGRSQRGSVLFKIWRE